MESKDLTSLLITYIGWRLRFVAQRPREVTMRSILMRDPRSRILKPNIDAFLGVVEAGGDLTPYLSLNRKLEITHLLPRQEHRLVLRLLLF